MGLDGAGKTSLLQYFATGSAEQEVLPTQGFHAVSINREELHIEFLESMHTTYTHCFNNSVLLIHALISW